jgi:hypothetical protein
MLTATHSAGSVVPKATVATARGATTQIVVRGLFYAIHEETYEGDKRTRDQILCTDQRVFCIQSAWDGGKKLESNTEKICFIV